ncbi:MAG: hypothetical protein WA876_12695 [Candidatus Acidiferrales bacterium]
MTISSSYLDALQALGYTEPEARFLYLVATHSGYFVARQFLGFTGSHWGKRTTTFWAKLHAQKHARTECFPKSGVIYHLFSRRLYRQIGRENLRNRREHEIEFIRQRIAILDFVLANPERTYLETEPEKVPFFCEQLKVPSHFLPARTYHGQRDAQPTTRYFVDKFPMFVGAEPLSSPVVTFTFIQGSEANMTEFVHHLEAYLPLFRQLPEFRFLYLARADSHFQVAKELFNSLVTIPLQSDAAGDIVRYFEIRKAWDLRLYSSLSEADLIFRNHAKARFMGDRFEHLYRGWKAGRVTERNIRQEFGSDGRRHSVDFAAQILPRIAPADAESIERRVQSAEIGSTTSSSQVSAPPDTPKSFTQARIERP